MKKIRMETEADLQKSLKSMPEDERIATEQFLTAICLEHSARRFPEQTKAAIKRNKLATVLLMDKAKDDNELLIGLYSIRDFGNLTMLDGHRLNP